MYLHSRTCRVDPFSGRIDSLRCQESVRVVRLDDLLLDGERAQSWALPLVKDVRLIKNRAHFLMNI